MANSPIGTSNRPYRARLSYINADAAAIALGDALMFASGMDDVQKVSSGAAATAPTLFAGIAVSTAAVGNPVELIAGGYCSAKFVVRTRAASTDSYSSVASIPAGNYLTIDTANNALASSGVGAALASPYLAILPSSVASIAGVASATSITHTVSTALYTVFLRNLF